MNTFILKYVANEFHYGKDSSCYIYRYIQQYFCYVLTVRCLIENTIDLKRVPHNIYQILLVVLMDGTQTHSFRIDRYSWYLYNRNYSVILATLQLTSYVGGG